MAKVFSRSRTTAKERLKISREHLQPLPAEYNSQHQDLFKALNAVKESEDSNSKYAEVRFDTPHHKLNYRDIVTIIGGPRNEDELMSINERVADAYSTMICRFGNDVRARDEKTKATRLERGRPGLKSKGRENNKSPEKGGKDVRRRSRSPDMGETRRGASREDRHEKVRAESTTAVKQSCVVITNEPFTVVKDAHNAEQPIEPIWLELLKNLGVTKDNIMDLDYLFFPYFDDPHYMLMGVAPKQGYVFVIDSQPNYYSTIDPDEISAFKDFYKLLLAILPEKADGWPLYTEYSKRSQTTDGSPDAPQQRDGYNCGVFAITSLFCLAFGFDLLTYHQSDMDEFKRPRIAAELSQGEFKDPFAYDMLELPADAHGNEEDLNIQDKVAGEETEKVEGLEVDDIAEYLAVPEEENDSSSSNSDLRAGLIIASKLKQMKKAVKLAKKPSKITKKQSKRTPKLIVPKIHQTRHRSKTTSTKDVIAPKKEKPVLKQVEKTVQNVAQKPAQVEVEVKQPVKTTQPEPTTKTAPTGTSIPFPTQLSPSTFTPYGFIYPTQPNIVQSFTRWDRNGLIGICLDRNGGLFADWKSWSLESEELFRKWVLNCVYAEGYAYQYVGEEPYGEMVPKRVMREGNEGELRPYRGLWCDGGNWRRSYDQNLEE